jgi:hypothetical protein
MTNEKRGMTSSTRSRSGSTPERRAWEPMSLTKVGSFGEVLRGSTGTMGDGGTKRP